MSKYVLVDVSSARLNRLWASVAARVETTPRLSRGGWFRVVAASMLVLVASVLTWKLASHSQARATFNQGTLETASDGVTVDLDDQSRLELGARTRLEWLSGDGRSASVRLKRGTLSCDLAPMPGRHFSVFAEQVEVRVTGTRFTVVNDRALARLEVSVQRGSVEVMLPGAEAHRRLGAGERWSMDQARTLSNQTPPVTTEPVQREASSASESSNDGALARESTAGTPRSPSEAPLVAPETTTSAKALLDQGNAARRSGDSRGAANAYQSLLTKYPSDPRVSLAAFELGRLRMGPLADIPGALRAFQRAAMPGSAFREDAMAHIVEAYSLSNQAASCKSARDAYLRDYPNGVHAAVVARQCGTK